MHHSSQYPSAFSFPTLLLLPSSFSSKEIARLSNTKNNNNSNYNTNKSKIKHFSPEPASKSVLYTTTIFCTSSSKHSPKNPHDKASSSTASSASSSTSSSSSSSSASSSSSSEVSNSSRTQKRAKRNTSLRGAATNTAPAPHVNLHTTSLPSSSLLDRNQFDDQHQQEDLQHLQHDRQQEQQLQQQQQQQQQQQTQTQQSHISLAQGQFASLHEITELLSDMLRTNKQSVATPKDNPKGHVGASVHAVIIFGKPLIRDQISNEYARRIITLIKRLRNDDFCPDVICFSGGKTEHGGLISQAAAGYQFFRMMCDQLNISVAKYTIILEETSCYARDNIRNILNQIGQQRGLDSLKKPHLTLISSDYHLFRLQEVHRCTPQGSILIDPELRGCSWSYLFTFYSSCVSPDATTSFLGRIMVLANELSIVLDNIRVVTQKKGFLHQDNIARLDVTSAKLREMTTLVQSSGVENNRRPSSSTQAFCDNFRSDARGYCEVLECCVYAIREVQSILKPFTQKKHITMEQMEKARALLAGAIVRMRREMDPDTALTLVDLHGYITELMSTVSTKKYRGSGRLGKKKLNFEGTPGANADLEIGDTYFGEDIGDLEVVDMMGFESSADLLIKQNLKAIKAEAKRRSFSRDQ